MHVCLVYDCLFPWTIGGAERWMRAVAEALAADGHEVTYLTRRQWDGDVPDLPGVNVIAVSRGGGLYGANGNRRIGPPLRFGLGVLRHLARHGRRYDVVHTASFPYFSLLAAGLVRRFGRYRIVVDWHEVWSAGYWRTYLGRLGWVGAFIQRRCARVTQEAFCFSRLHAQRLVDEGLRGEPTILRGEWIGQLERPQPAPARPLVVFAGRLIAEKNAPAVVGAVVRAAEEVPGLRGAVYGDGPARAEVEAEIARHGAHEIVEAPGFVSESVLGAALASALCAVLPSSREGYGMVVVEAAAVGVPTVTVAGPDNAAVEHIEPGVNGFVAPSADPEALAEAIVAVARAGDAMRASTADWFAANSEELSFAKSMARVVASYNGAVNGYEDRSAATVLTNVQ